MESSSAADHLQDVAAQTLPALVDLRASSSPSKIFIDFAAPSVNAPQISFADFRALCISAALFLCSRGVSCGHRVAFFSPNSLQYALLLFGAQRIGAVPVPLNFALPIDTVIALLRVGKCQALVIPKNLDCTSIHAHLPGLTLIRLEEFSLLDKQEEGSLPELQRTITTNDVAIILHTSGTLKQPKLVPLTHRNILANREAVRRHWKGLLTDNDSTLGWMPFYHVIGLAHDLIGQLYVGGRYIMAQLPSNQPVTGALLAEQLVAARPSIFYCVPWILDQMRPMISTNGALLGVLKNLKLLMSGGVALSSVLSSFLHENKIPIVDGLGMTDTAGAIFLGDPRIASGNLRLLDGLSSEFVSVPGLSTAELRFNSGPCVTSGYLNDDEANASCFIGGGVFRTFDLFECVNAEQRIYRYCGRIDDIFALEGGEKANPLPIEQGLTESCPLLRRVALLGNRRAFLVAVVEPKPDAFTSMSSVELEHVVWQAVQSFNVTLPSYARIRRRALLILSANTTIPVTPKGSVRRHELEKMLQPQLDAIYTEANDLSQYDAIRTWFASITKDPARLSLRTVLEALTRLLERLLDLPSLSASDLSSAFASLGIDSQRAVQLTAVAARTFSLDLRPTLVFQHSSPAELASYIYRTLTAQRISTIIRSPTSTTMPVANRSIAVTGYAYRFPGGVIDDASFWQLLASGSDAISMPPTNRTALNDSLSSRGVYTLRAGYLKEDLQRFDSKLFRISDQEASHLDPQQRLLLELTWEALEQAFLGNASQRRALRIGVWVGLSAHDFELQLLQRSRVSRFTATGSSFATAAGRIAYSFDLKGPCLTLDTACSSSLVATHLAKQSLLAGECDVAIVGSANVIIAPEPWLAACKAKLLSTSGVCRAFDGAADGYVRAEGAAVVVLRPMEQAIKAGNVVHGCIIGSAVNQDGQSNGFTAPQGSAQEDVIRVALREASLLPDAVQVVETHGTGTPLGDPVELDALCAAYGPRDKPLLLGALKSVTGHMEAPAGLGGLIKVLLCLQRSALPPHPHFEKLNPLASSPASVVVPTKLTPWQPIDAQQPRRAGISSFGISGTNSHVIVEEAPARSNRCSTQADPRTRHICPLSAATPAALLALRSALQASTLLDRASLGDICFTLATARAELPYRWTCVAANASELRSHLSTPIHESNLRATRDRKIVFVFPGQGTLLPGLGRELYTSQPLFKRMMDECSEVLSPLLGFSLVDKLYHSTEAIATSATLTQCTLVSLGASLARLLSSWNIVPDVVLGHSSGELTAAHVAGLLSLQDVLRFAVLRGRLMDQAASTRAGSMLAIFAPISEIEELVKSSGQSPQLSIAANNGPNHTVVSGVREAVEHVAALATARGMKMKELGGVATAFHSPLLDPILDEFEQSVQEKIHFTSQLNVPLISTATGRYADAKHLSSAAHWRSQLRGTVRFHEALQTLQGDGTSAFVEMGGRAVLLGLIRRAITVPEDALLLPCLARTDGASDAEALMSTVASLWQSGVAVDWTAFHSSFAPSLVPQLPTYRFDRKSYWFADDAEKVSVVATPSLSRKDNSTRRFSATEPYVLNDHLVHGKAVIPGAAHLLYLAEAAAPLSLVSVSFLQAVVVEETCDVLYRIANNQATVETHNEQGKSILHVECQLGSPSLLTHAPMGDLPAAKSRSASEFYAYAEATGLHCGPSFRWVQAAHASSQYARTILDQPNTPPHIEKLTAGFMDSVLQGAWFVFNETESNALHLPVAIGAAHFATDLTISLPAVVHVKRLPDEKDGVCVDFIVTGSDNINAVILKGVIFRRFVKSSFFRTSPSIYHVSRQVEHLNPPTKLAEQQWSIQHSDAAGDQLAAALCKLHPSCFGTTASARVVFVLPEFAASPSLETSTSLAQCCMQIRDALIDLSNKHPNPHFVVISWSHSAIHLQAIGAFLRSARLELPSVSIRHVDIPNLMPDIITTRLATEILVGSAERASLSTERTVERLLPYTLPTTDTSSSSLIIESNCTYLVTGAYGGVGQLLCAWLASHGAGSILCVGRNRPGVSLPACCKHLCDDVMQVTDLTGVRGVFHCAGASADASLTNMQVGQVSELLYAKLEGTLHLHTLSTRLQRGELHHFVLFSSVASVLGSPGQAAYALANGALDGIASFRRSMSLPVMCLNWGPWQDVGMAKRLSKHAEGVHQFSPDEALTLLGQAMSCPTMHQLVVVRAQWHATLWAKRRVELLQALFAASTSTAGTTTMSSDTRAILSSIEALVQGASQAPRADETFASLGVDSLMAIELRDALAAKFATPLPGSLVYDRPTLRLCAEHIRSLIGTATGASPSVVAPPQIRSSASTSDVAIVAYTCRFPGGATDLSSLWRLLASGTDAISASPPLGRWSSEWAKRMVSTRGGFLRDVDLFDASFFGISPREAQLLDPQQRLLLELAWEALESSAQLPLRDPRVGVWIGVSSHDYETLVRSSGESSDPYFATGNGHSVCAGRLSYFFGLTGPSMSIDTACSSSLVGVHLARASLLAGECNMALVGGVNLILQPELSAAFSAAGMLSPDGQCRTFDASASGYVRSEGAAVVLLKRLEDALSHGDQILGVVKGSSMNQDGHSNGLTAPSGPSQVAVIRAALSSASLSASDNSFIEAHGTGTALGDAVELGALAEVFQPSTRERALHIGAIKSNLGHTEAAAGLASLGKTLCMLHSKHIPPHLHFSRPNAALAQGLRVATQLQPWEAPRPLRAGVSSFGFSGTNAHVIVEEAPSIARPTSSNATTLLPLVLSAHSHRSLVSLAKAVAAYMQRTEQLDWRALAYTLACRRQHLPQHRLYILSRSSDEARTALQNTVNDLQEREHNTSSSLQLALILGQVDESVVSSHYDAQQHFTAAMQLGGGVQVQRFAASYAVARLCVESMKPDIVYANGLQLLAAAAALGALTLGDALQIYNSKHSVKSIVAHAPRCPLARAAANDQITVEQLRSVEFWGEVLGNTLPPLRKSESIPTPGIVVCIGQQHLPVSSSPQSPLSLCASPASSLASELPAVLAALWQQNRRVEWNALFAPPIAPLFDLPSYPFDRSRHWVSTATSAPASRLPTSESIDATTDSNALLAIVLCELQELLRLGNVPTSRQLTELGFDSIMAIELVERLVRRTGRRLKLDAVFARPTAEAIAVLIAGAAFSSVAEKTANEAASSSAAPSESFPLTPLQRSYFMAAADRSQPSCHLFLEYEFNGDVARLERAWNALIQRHEMLRAVFTDDAEQRILADVPIYSFARLATAEDLADAQSCMREQKFDPHKWPLFDIRVAPARLLISLDFLVFDLASLSLVFTEWRMLYEDAAHPLPPIGISFREFVARAALRTDSAAEDYWAKRIADFPNGPALPPAPSSPTATTQTPPHFAHLEHAVPSQSWSTIQERLGTRGLTSASALLACYAAVLNGWTTEGSYAIVATLFRPPPGSRHLVGDFSTTLLFAVEAPWRSLPLPQLLSAVQTRWLADLSHSAVEGPELMQRIAKAHGRTPSMPVVFTLAVKDQERLDWDAWLGPRRTRVSQTPHVLLDCQVHETAAGEMVLAWDYAVDAFPQGLIEDMFAAFVHLVSCLQTNETWSADRAVQVVPPAHLSLYTTVNHTTLNLGSIDERLHEQFFRVATETPDALCLITATAEFTYSQLASLARTLASRLRMAPASRVGILLPKGWQQIVAALGSLHAGMTFVPLDVHWPEERLALVASLASLAAIITNSVHKPSWYTNEVVLVDAHKKEGEEGSHERSNALMPSSQTAAYVIFTSGSTGQPKGVAISHCGALNTVRDVNKRFNIKSSDRIFALSELYFDLAIWDIFGTLSAGACMVLPPPEAKRDPSMWLAMVHKHQVSVWNSVPRLAELLAEENDATPVQHTLRLVLMSGDWIPLSLPAKLRRSFGRQVELIAMGGATEASIWSVLYHIPEQLPPLVPSILYGKAMTNQSLHVLDPELHERPLYVPGELYIGGIGVALHYLDAAQTAKSFVQHPRLGRLYRTGDNARWLPDGNLEFMGRRDTQAKIAGVRIELGEVEATALAAPGVKNAIAIVKNDALVLHYVGTAESSALRAHISARLPAAYCPSLLVRCAALPLTANGKIDRAALLASSTPDGTPSAVAVQETASPIQEQVLKQWRELLTAPVSLDSNVFAAGATSLSIIRLATRLRRVLGVSVSAAALLKLSTPRQQAALYTAAATVPTESAVVFSAPTTRRNPIPASFIQQHMWHAESIDGDARINTVALAVDIDGPLSAPAMRAALEWLLQRHDALRTCLVEHNARLYLATVTNPRLKLNEISVTNANDSEAKLTSLAAEQWTHGNGLPIRVFVVRQANTSRATLLMLLHHSAVDGWSSAILARELSHAYNAFASNNTKPSLAPPPPPVSYADFATWEQENLLASIPSRIAYWKPLLADLPSPAAALPPPPPPESLSNGVAVHSLHFVIDAGLAEGARTFAKSNNVSLFAVLLSVFAALLYRRTGMREFIIGTVTPGRSASPQLEDIVGCFINLVPIVCKPGGKTFMELLTAMMTTWQAALTNEVPLHLLRQQLGLQDVPFRILFILQNKAPMPEFRECLVSRRHVAAAATEFDLTVSLEEAQSGGGLELSLECAAISLSPAYAERFANAYVTLLGDALAAPLQSPLSALSCADNASHLTELEKQLLALSSEAIGRRSLAIDDAFIALDLDSTKLKRLVAALRSWSPQLQQRHLQTAASLTGLIRLLANPHSFVTLQQQQQQQQPQQHHKQ